MSLNSLSVFYFTYFKSSDFLINSYYFHYSFNQARKFGMIIQETLIIWSS